jgi:hypothetical protein
MAGSKPGTAPSKISNLLNRRYLAVPSEPPESPAQPPKELFFVGSAKSGVIETVKHSGLYHDDLASKGIGPSRNTAENAGEIMQKCSGPS